MATGSLVFAMYQFFRTMVLINIGLRTTGTVIAGKSWGASGNKLFMHVVQFKTEDESEIEFRNFSFFPQKVNSVVNIRYNPKKPKYAKIDSWGKLWGFTLVYGPVGMFFTILGLGLLGSRGF